MIQETDITIRTCDLLCRLDKLHERLTDENDHDAAFLVALSREAIASLAKKVLVEVDESTTVRMPPAHVANTIEVRQCYDPRNPEHDAFDPTTWIKPKPHLGAEEA